MYISTNNDFIKKIKKLNEKKYRDIYNEFLVEGEHLVLEALNNIRRSFQFLLEQVDWEIIICKVDLQISDSIIKLNNSIALLNSFN